MMTPLKEREKKKNLSPGNWGVGLFMSFETSQSKHPWLTLRTLNGYAIELTQTATLTPAELLAFGYLLNCYGYAHGGESCEVQVF